MNLLVPDSAITLESVVARLGKLKCEPLPYSAVGVPHYASSFVVPSILAAASHSQTIVLIQDPIITSY